VIIDGIPALALSSDVLIPLPEDRFDKVLDGFADLAFRGLAGALLAEGLQVGRRYRVIAAQISFHPVRPRMERFKGTPLEIIFEPAGSLAPHGTIMIPVARWVLRLKRQGLSATGIAEVGPEDIQSIEPV
jgi:hypothetical protein